jgi:hypothetical protein
LSPLTKLFVTLHVIVSLLLTAGTIVFVNQVNDYKKLVDDTKQQLNAANARATSANDLAQAAKATAEESVRQITQQHEQAKQDANRLQQQVADRDRALAGVQTQLALLQVDNTNLTGALRGSEDTKGKLQDQVSTLRESNDKFVTQNAQLNQTVTDLTNRLDVTERERKLLAEQLTEAKNQVQRQAGLLREAGVSQAQFATGGTRLGAPPMQGVVRDVRPIRGILYASISLGSADSVTKGMEFKVINRETGAFLGVLTVDSVELNESTGRLSGPRVSEIQRGAEVRTQF